MLPALRILAIGLLTTCLAAGVACLLFSAYSDATLAAVLFGSVGAIAGTVAAAAGEIVRALRTRA